MERHCPWELQRWSEHAGHLSCGCFHWCGWSPGLGVGVFSLWHELRDKTAEKEVHTSKRYHDLCEGLAPSCRASPSPGTTIILGQPLRVTWTVRTLFWPSPSSQSLLQLLCHRPYPHTSHTNTAVSSLFSSHVSCWNSKVLHPSFPFLSSPSRPLPIPQLPINRRCQCSVHSTYPLRRTYTLC